MVKGYAFLVAVVVLQCLVNVYGQVENLNATNETTNETTNGTMAFQTDAYFAGNDTTFENDTGFENATDFDNATILENVPSQKTSWARCLAEGAGNAPVHDSSILSIFLSWCRDYKKVIPCLKTGIPQQAEDNALDLFISLTNPVTLTKRSKVICRKIPSVGSRILCAFNTSKADAGVCTWRFSVSLRQIYAVYKTDGLKRSLLKKLTCDLTHETTRCLEKTLSSCDKDVKKLLLTYYALFTAKKCIYKPTDPPVDEMSKEAITTRCAKETSKLAKTDGPATRTLRDTVIKGMRVDCQTYEARFKCYERELKNETHFWDRWLRHTFDLQNAIEGHREMCPRIDEIIELLSPDCFNQSESSIMACENDFTVTADSFRHIETEQNLTDTELAELACGCTLQKATCYKKAFHPCSQTLAEMMSHNVVSLLPKECRDKALGGNATFPDLKEIKLPADTKAISDTIAFKEASVKVDGKLTGKSSSSTDGAAVNKASNL